MNRLPLMACIILLLLSSTVSAQRGEKTIGISINPARFYDNFYHHVLKKELWSFGAGVHFSYQVFDRFGVMINPHFRYFTKVQIFRVCLTTIPCPNHLQYSTIDLPIVISFNLLNNPEGKTKIYLQAGYAYQYGIYRKFSNEGGFGEYYSDTDTQGFHQGHQLLGGVEVKHSIGSKYAFSWGAQFHKPFVVVVDNSFASSYAPLFQMNLRFSRVFY